MTTPIETIRKEIDDVDNQIQDLLARRAELAMTIGEEKRKLDLPMIQPDREASKLRALLERHTGKLSKETIVRIWREIISAVSLLQTDMKIAVATPTGNIQEHWDIARDYFGSTMPMQGVANPLMAIAMVREGDANFAVLPWPEDGIENPWWSYLSNDDPDQVMHVVVRLPYGDPEEAKGHPLHRALVVAKTPFKNSGRDHSFLLLDLDQNISRAKVVDKIKALDLTALSIYSRRPRTQYDRSLHLVEVNAFVSHDDPRLKQILEKLESDDGQCFALGGYPVLPLSGQSVDIPQKKTA